MNTLPTVGVHSFDHYSNIVVNAAHPLVLWIGFDYNDEFNVHSLLTSAIGLGHRVKVGANGTTESVSSGGSSHHGLIVGGIVLVIVVAAGALFTARRRQPLRPR